MSAPTNKGGVNRFTNGLLANFAAQPDTVFCRMIGADGEKTILWHDLEKSCAGYAAAYRKAGLQAGDVVLIFLKHTPHLYGSFFGAMLGGYTPSFMPCVSPRQDPAVYWHSHCELLNHIKPRAVVASGDVFAEMAAAGLSLGGAVSITADDIGYEETSFAAIDEDAVGLLQHSSGTTGLKKGVALSFAAISDQLDSYGQAIDVSKRDVVVSWLPLYHDMGLIACCLLPAYFGIPVIHIDAFHWTSKPEMLLTEIEKSRGTLVWQPNFAFEHLVNVASGKAAQFDLSSIRALISCSEPCKPSTFDRFATAFASAGLEPEKLQCCYAMAETVFAVSQTEFGVAPQRFRADAASLEPGRKPIRVDAEVAGVDLIAVGMAIDGMEFATCDQYGNIQPEGTVGEIALKSRFLFTGYNADATGTAERLRDGRYFTRDVGFMDDGQIYILGRVDDMMIVNGRNIYAHEVEAAINGVAGIKPGRCVAVAQFDRKAGSDTLVLIAERDASVARLDADIRKDVLNILHSTFNVMARKVKLTDPGWLVKTTSGKINRKDNISKLMAETSEMN